MNADGSAGVDAVTSAGARIEYLTAIAAALLAIGLLSLLGAAAAFS